MTDAGETWRRTLRSMHRLRSLQCPIIVGRDDLLDLADRRLAEASLGHGQFLLLAGEAGIGKTRLLDAIRRKSRAAGFVDANGSVAPQDHEVPSSLIGDLARTVRRMPDFGDLGDDLLAMRGERDADALGSRRLYVLDVADRIVAAIDRPVMLNFEDLQWADEISLEIVGELARRARDLPVLIVGAYRTEDLPPGAFFREWRARLIAQRQAEEARLAPLTYDQTALMTTLILDTGLPAPREVVAAVHERTDGIPLHVEELLGALGDEARTDGRKIRDAQVPETIEDAILARIAKLSPEAREVARAGAVIGRCFIPAVLAGVMDRPVADLDGPIAELVDRSYLYDGGDVGFIDFRHQLLRDVLYRSVPASDLRRFHARAAEFGATLDGQSEIHSSVHFERAGLRTQAFRTALAGAREASRMSGRQEAYDLYRRAIDNMPIDLPAEQQAELYDEYSGAASAIERIDQSESATRIARQRFLEAGRPLDAAGGLLSLAILTSKNAEPIDRPLELMGQAMAEVEQQPDSLERTRWLGHMFVARAHLELAASQFSAALVDADAGRLAAEASADRETALEAELTAARIDIVAGRYEAGLARGLNAAREARDEGFESVGVTGYRNLAIAAARVMDYEAAETAIGEGLRYADAIEQSHCRQMMATTSAFMAWAAGRWDEADGTARQELVERGCRRGVLGSLDVIGLVAMSRGHVEDAHHWLDESLEAGRRTGEIQNILPALCGLAELDLVAGDPRSAAGRCEEALELAITSGERALLVPFLMPGVRALLAVHRPDEAERWSRRVRDVLVGWEGMAGPAIAHADGLLRLATGSLVAARDSLEGAVRGWTDRRRTWEASWARLDLAQCLMRSNRYGESAPLLAEVRAAAEALDSDPLVFRADELARAGRGRGTLEEPWRPLTAREFEVARLIADGLTNAEIADQLEIAPKTASAHVEHILAKLGVTRRAEIAAWTAAIGRPLVAAADRNGREGAVAVRSR
jgi:DNA-binding CsgD family transcriptional regulator/tetratricopeptide (TPR) repeat protein